MTTPKTTPAESESRHTPEPWIFDPDAGKEIAIFQAEGGLAICDIVTTTGEGFYRPDSAARGEANAARIVACVNACEGMSGPVAEIARLRASNAELFEALDILQASPNDPRAHRRALDSLSNAGGAL